MVPSRLITLEALPLNRNGKVDLPALAALAMSEQQSERRVVGPRDLTEKRLVGIWAEVLKLERIGVHDNFFDLGGHSLLATQIISRIRNVFHVQFPLFSFLESPTIAELALKISQYPPVETEEEEVERLLRELEGTSDEEVETMLSAEKEKEEAAGGGTVE